MASKRFPAGEGPSQRQLRVGELIRRRLSDVLTRDETHDPALSSRSITVTEVRCSSDLRVATVFVLPLGGEGRGEALAALRRNAGPLRHLVSRQLALKFAPELRFAIDDSFDRMDDARRLFAEPRVRRDIDVPDQPAEDHDDGSSRH